MTAFNLDPARYEGRTRDEWHVEKGTTDIWGNCLSYGMARPIARALSAFSTDPTEDEAEANARLIADAPQILAEALRLKAENERLRADAARLDWFEAASRAEHQHCPYADGADWVVPYLDQVAGGSGGGVSAAYFGTLRAAIDAAMGLKP